MHNHDLNLGNVRGILDTVRTGVEQAISECESLVKKKKAELARMRGGR